MKHNDPLKHRSSWLAATVVAAVLVAGCGGGGGGGATVNGAAEEVPSSVGDSVAAMVNYLTSLFALTSETTEPMGVNSLTLAVDETAEPSPLP